MAGAVHSRLAGALGVGYVLMVMAVTVNSVLASWDGPHLQWPIGEPATGAAGLAVCAVLGLGMLGVAVVEQRATRLQWGMVAAVGAWLVAPALSMALHGTLHDGRFWSVAGIGIGLASSATLIPRPLLTRALLGLGWFYGWGSVAAGFSDLVVGWPAVLIADSDDRYARWLGLFGVNVESVAFLNGLTPGRVYVGLTCGLLAVFTVRVALARRRAGWLWLSVAGMVLAIAWSFSRTGAVILVIGLIAAIVPWERIRPGLLVLAVFTVLMTPLALSALLSSARISDGTTRWRFALWRTYVTDPATWSPFGIGPLPTMRGRADHAHQQLIEAQATGGWVALAGCITFIVLGCLAARRWARFDNRASVAVLFGMAAIFQLDVVTFSNNYRVLNSALVLIVVVLVAAAASTRSAEPASEPERMTT